MAWIDNGRGQWVQQTSEGEVNTPKPTTPPPSAAGGAGGVGGTGGGLAYQQPSQTPATPAAARPPMPTQNPGIGYKWVFEPSINNWEKRGASKSETMDQQLAAAKRPAAPPVVPLANAGASATPAPPANPNEGMSLRGQQNTQAWQDGTDATSGVQPEAKPAGGVIGYDPGYVRTDRTAYDQAAAGYDRAVNTFQSELDRLSGVDPFGNQAFLRQATDRATAQAGGLAAGGLSTATARAGNMRQAQGVQSAMSAQGRDQQAIQRSQDEVQAGALRNQAATGLANTIGQRATNELELQKIEVQTGMANMDAYLKKYGIDAQLDQQDIESLRNANIEIQKLGESARQADVDALLTKYGVDQQTQIALKQIAAGENFSVGDMANGIVGAVAGIAGGMAMASDRRFKFDVQDPDLRDLQDFLGRTKGKLYQYKDPGKPGRRAGLNYGPMAQDLAKSKIGKTVVVQGKDGLYVDTGRLALADHAALADLARQVAEMKAEKK